MLENESNPTFTHSLHFRCKRSKRLVSASVCWKYGHRLKSQRSYLINRLNLSKLCTHNYSVQLSFSSFWGRTNSSSSNGGRSPPYACSTLCCITKHMPPKEELAQFTVIRCRSCLASHVIPACLPLKVKRTPVS